MKRDLQKRVNIAINTYLPEFIEQFLEDKNDVIEEAKKNKTAPQDLIDLVITLKYWANPDGGYLMRLGEAEKINFKELAEIVNKPTKILAQEKSFTPEDEVILANLIQIKLNTMADDLIKKYNLQEHIKATIIADNSTIQQWWENKSRAEQEKIRTQYESLTPDQKEKLTHTVKTYYPQRNVVTIYPDPFFYFCMSNYHADLCHHHYNLMMPDLFDMIILNQLLFHSSVGSNADCNVGCSGSDDGDSLLVAGAVIGFIALVSAGIVGGLYGAKKAFNSLLNTLQGDKVARSLFRLAGIGGGGYGGWLAGSLAGAALGSVIPGFGTAAGFIVGGIFGAGLGAGLGALITKYVAKGLSLLTYNDSFNPTNPEKYELSSHQKIKLQKIGYDLDVVVTMMHAIKREKDKFDKWGDHGSIPFTQAREKKNHLNHILKQLKQGKIEGPVKIGSLHYDPLLSRFDVPEKAKNFDSKQIIRELATDPNNYSNFIASAPLAESPNRRQNIVNIKIDSAPTQATGTDHYIPRRPQ